MESTLARRQSVLESGVYHRRVSIGRQLLFAHFARDRFVGGSIIDFIADCLQIGTHGRSSIMPHFVVSSGARLALFFTVNQLEAHRVLPSDRKTRYWSL